MITKDRAYALSDFLAEDKECAAKVEGLSVSEAVAEINKHGFDYTESELMEFISAIDNAQKGDELNEDALENVSGGSIIGHYIRGVVDGTRDAFRDAWNRWCCW